MGQGSEMNTGLNNFSPQVAAAIVAGVVSLITAAVTALVTVVLGMQRLRRDFGLDFAAERVANQLLRDSQWRLRSFRVIKEHLGGFDDDELRKTLVRAGAIRFKSKSGKELWGLLDRVADLLGVTSVPWDPGER
jgi:hypothetical protein